MQLIHFILAFFLVAFAAADRKICPLRPFGSSCYKDTLCKDDFPSETGHYSDPTLSIGEDMNTINSSTSLETSTCRPDDWNIFFMSSAIATLKEWVTARLQ